MNADADALDLSEDEYAELARTSQRLADAGFWVPVADLVKALREHGAAVEAAARRTTT